MQLDRFPTEVLLMEAARRHDEWSRIEATVPHLRVVPKLPPPDTPSTGRLDLLPFEWEVLAAVDGQRDLHALASLHLLAHLHGRPDGRAARAAPRGCRQWSTCPLR